MPTCVLTADPRRAAGAGDRPRVLATSSRSLAGSLPSRLDDERRDLDGRGRAADGDRAGRGRRLDRPRRREQLGIAYELHYVLREHTLAVEVVSGPSKVVELGDAASSTSVWRRCSTRSRCFATASTEGGEPRDYAIGLGRTCPRSTSALRATIEPFAPGRVRFRRAGLHRRCSSSTQDGLVVRLIRGSRRGRVLPPMAYEFKLPDLGEGLTEGEIARWLVSVGQEVAEDDPLVEIQTDKTTVEIPRRPPASSRGSWPPRARRSGRHGDRRDRRGRREAAPASEAPRGRAERPGKRRVATSRLRRRTSGSARRRSCAGSRRSSASTSRRVPATARRDASPRTTSARGGRGGERPPRTGAACRCAASGG